jgi:hypothetical protein
MTAHGILMRLRPLQEAARTHPSDSYGRVLPAAYLQKLPLQLKAWRNKAIAEVPRLRPPGATWPPCNSCAWHIGMTRFAAPTGHREATLRSYQHDGDCSMAIYRTSPNHTRYELQQKRPRKPEPVEEPRPQHPLYTVREALFYPRHHALVLSV